MSAVGRVKEGSGVGSLGRILEPHAPEEFLASSWGVRLLHVRGRAGRFSDLMPWPRLNEILRRHRLDFPRLRLVRDGRPAPVSSFLKHVTGGRGRTNIPRLKTDELAKQLREGATLVLDAVDELSEPVEELAEGLELLFHEHVQVNLYAGWQTSRGFDLHLDDHDVFILQVAGRKRWSVYGMTRPYPLVNDVEKAQKPTHEPLWEGTLEDGDLLYIPRGWWHVAEALAEPTVHLTVGVHNRTGLDFLHRLSRVKGTGSSAIGWSLATILAHTRCRNTSGRDLLRHLHRRARPRMPHAHDRYPGHLRPGSHQWATS